MVDIKSINERKERVVNDNYNRCLEVIGMLVLFRKNLRWNVELEVRVKF